MEAIRQRILKLEEIIQHDEGNRGIGDILLRGELIEASEALMAHKSIAIITGFPCLMNFEPPTETDGPPGALAIARACLGLGKRVVIMTDECNEAVVLAAVCGANLQQFMVPIENEDDDEMNDLDSKMMLKLESFPPLVSFHEADERRLDEIMKTVDLVLAIERSGPSSSGKYYTMRKRDMSDMIAPLDRIFSLGKTSIGIGDGGNEVGMGKVYERILSSSIQHAADIACVVNADHLIVSSVSNWGGYALAFALSILSSHMLSDEALGDLRALFFESLLPSERSEFDILKLMIEAGARDGVSGLCELSVDGMPLEKTYEILNRLKAV